MQRPHDRESRSLQSTLSMYFREINATPMLGAEEEKELAQRIAAGDNAARDRLVRANLRLVVSIARSYTGRGLDLPDLIAEGNLGLLRAVGRFDPARGVRFSTYASYWIKQAMRQALVDTGKTIRVSRYVVGLMRKWRRAAAELEVELGRAPTEQEIARSLRLLARTVNTLRNALRVCTWAPQSDRPASGLSLDELLVDDVARTPETPAFEDGEFHQAKELLDQMGGREALVLRMRFGLDDEGPRTLKEIGTRLGLTSERVRQIQRKALSQLRAGLRAG